jgi:hypothetical protein
LIVAVALCMERIYIGYCLLSNPFHLFMNKICLKWKKRSIKSPDNNLTTHSIRLARKIEQHKSSNELLSGKVTEIYITTKMTSPTHSGWAAALKDHTIVSLTGFTLSTMVTQPWIHRWLICISFGQDTNRLNTYAIV